MFCSVPAQYAEKLYEDDLPSHEPPRSGAQEDGHDSVRASGGVDIESEIRKEIEELKSGGLLQTQTLFSPVRLDIPCGEGALLTLDSLLGWAELMVASVAFIKVADPIDPVKLVHEICIDAQRCPQQRSSCWIQRMTPVTMIRKVFDSGLEELAARVLKPHFHSGGPPKKVKSPSMSSTSCVRHYSPDLSLSPFCLFSVSPPPTHQVKGLGWCGVSLPRRLSFWRRTESDRHRLRISGPTI